MTTTSAQELDRLVALPETAARPYDVYASLRDAHPVFFSETLDCWLVTRHVDALAVLENTETFSSAHRVRRDAVAPEVWEAFGGFDGFFWSDPPAYDERRRAWTSAFKPRLKGLAEVVARVTAELLDSVREVETFDVVSALAFPLPATVVFELLGVPPSDRDLFRRIATTLIQGAGPPAAAAMDEAAAWLRTFLVERQRDPRDDILSDLVAGLPPVEELDPIVLRSEIVDIVHFLLAGHETTTSAITSGALVLLERPEARERFLRDRAVRSRAVEEILRFESPLQFVERRVAAPTTLAGCELAAGSTVRVVIGSANRDERVFERPGELQIDRAPNPHLAFGHGCHLCLGAPLARLEIPIALEALLGGTPSLQLACGTDELTWRPNAMFHAVEALPVVRTTR
ncbi:MAG: cytochrome P450 [Gaiellales bacterium]